MVIKMKTEVKRAVRKRINKSDTSIPCRSLCPVESHGRVDGLYTLRSAHEEGFT